MQTWTDLKFADGEYTFKLGLAQISELEKKCDAGIGAIYARTSKGRYGFHDGEIYPELAEYRFPELVEIVRQALIGGGQGMVNGERVQVSSIRANDLVDAYLLGATKQRWAMTQLWALAYAILHALIEGYDPPKKEAPAKAPAGPTPTKNSTTRKRSPTARK